jgi:hypothetical protein
VLIYQKSSLLSQIDTIPWVLAHISHFVFSFDFGGVCVRVGNGISRLVCPWPMALPTPIKSAPGNAAQ